MKRIRIAGWWMVAGMLCLVQTANALEYFVAPHGRDDHDGLSRATAFAGIQRGLDALATGDTLTVLPGEYFGSARRDDLGGPEQETTLRAEIRGTVVLRGDVPAPVFEKVPGRRFVYVADFDREPQAVNELDTLTLLESFPNPAELEFRPGGFHYDAAARKLYLSTSDLQAPRHHRYTVSLVPAHGLYLERPQRVVLDGLAATGFNNAEQLPSNPGFRTAWGIMVARGKDCVIRHCTAYFNGGGIGLRSETAGGNLVADSRAYANYSKYCGEGGNILAFHPNHDTIRDSLAHSSRVHGIRMYGTARGPAVIRRGLGWGNGGADLYIKGQDVDQYGLAERSVATGDAHVLNVRHALIGRANLYHRDIATPRDTVRLAQEPGLDPDREFADPLNLDFRLQPHSRFRNTGPDGADRGPFPYARNIYYVAPDGSDTHDGLSTESPWRSLARARGLRFLRSGDTVYLAAGEHDAPDGFWAGDAGEGTVFVRGRGTDPAILRGAMHITGSTDLVFERLTFTGPVSVRDSTNIVFNHCRFTAPGTGLDVRDVSGLQIRQSAFEGFDAAAIALETCNGVTLNGNLFANRTAPALRIDRLPAIRYSDYNAYYNPERVWQAGGRNLALEALRADHDRYSRAVAPGAILATGGPLGRGVGPYRAPRDTPLRVAGPFVHAVTDTTADLEWTTSRLTACTLSWGPPSNPQETIELDANGFASFSLTGLQPDTLYAFVLRFDKPFLAADDDGPTPGEAALEISFRTAARPAPATTYYVAPDGDDARTGLRRKDALRTISAAAARAVAGDTVTVAGGTYRETVRVRGTGTKARPVTFNSVPGEKVILDGDGRALNQAFVVTGKQHVYFDGFYFTGFGRAAHEQRPWRLSSTGEFLLYRTDHARITRCFKDGRGAGYSPNFVAAWKCDGLLVENCVILGGFSGPPLLECPNLLFRHCVFVRNMIAHLIIENFADQKAYLMNNIFTDSLPNKSRSGLLVLGRAESLVADNNAFFNRAPDAERKPVFLYGTEAWARVVAAWDLDNGDRSDSVITENLFLGAAEFSQRFDQGFVWFGDPRFQGTVDRDFKDREGNALDYIGDAMLRGDIIRDFDDLFATHPELVKRRIGLRPEAFRDVHFNTREE